MDQVASERSRAHERLEQFVSALGSGIIVVDADGHVVWMDNNTRRRVNGGLQNLDLPIARTDRSAIDCFVSTVEVMINGESVPICVIQETLTQQQGVTHLAQAIEAIMADTSWFTRALIDKLKMWRQTSDHPTAKLSDLDMLTDREREILGLICDGNADGEMSTMLDLSRNTVRNHVASLYRKIGVNRRSAAIIWARERGITSHDALARRRHRRSLRADRGP